MRRDERHSFRRDFARQHSADMARMDRARRVITGLAILFWLVVIGAGGRLLLHPERIGAFVGRVAAGYEAAPSRPGGTR